MKAPRTPSFGPALRWLILTVAALVPLRAVQAQPPAGLAASALADSSFSWIHRTTPGFRAYFLADSYPAAHQDSLLERLPAALRHARRLIDAPPVSAPIDVFFIETRAQMTALIGGRATGFAEPATRTVLLVTNPDWRAFERHEVMHVVAVAAWGPPARGTDWLQEGLAQAADAACAGHSNSDVLLGLTARHGWIPLETMLTRFREQSDLRAYLQAAAFVEHLLQRFGPQALEHLWRQGASGTSVVGNGTLAEAERRWRGELRASRTVDSPTLVVVEDKGCG